MGHQPESVEAGPASGTGPSRVAIVVADGDHAPGALAALARSEPGALVIAADGGARRALDEGVRPDIVIGDGDSLAAEVRASLEQMGVPLRLEDPDKDESDTELCLLAALESGAQRILILGALGGRRPEHSVANLLLLADERFDGRSVVVLDGATRVTRMGTPTGEGALGLQGRPGHFVSLFALDGEVRGVRTEGLRFPLHAETLLLGRTRGLSNEMLGERARVTTQLGRLLVIQTARPDAAPEVMT
ncbi:thiamine diphosphokinase [soil metagenome]